MKNDTGEKIISTNPIASTNYFLEELVEAGLVLLGTEIKSIRTVSPNLRDAYVEVTPKFEAWLVNMHVGPYSHGNIWNHDAKRRRKLLLHAKQIKQLFGALTQEGKTIVPTRMYFLNGRVKVEIAMGKGKKKGDKREDQKKRSQDREMDQAMKQRRRSER